jgi:uncharacterized protein YkwD
MLAMVMTGVVLAVGLTVSSPASGATNEEVAAALFRKINNKRAKLHGLNRTEEWSVIVREATEHSEFQLRDGEISHDGFSGRANRIRSAGSGINGVCENVAFVRGINDLKDIVRVFYRGWDRSPPHHDCMFDEDFRSTWSGVGIAHSGSTWYATYIAVQDTSPSTP